MRIELTEKVWSCPCCGVRRELKDLDGNGIGMCYRCNKKYDIEALIICGLTGPPLPFRASSFEENWALKHGIS